MQRFGSYVRYPLEAGLIDMSIPHIAHAPSHPRAVGAESPRLRQTRWHPLSYTDGSRDDAGVLFRDYSPLVPAVMSCRGEETEREKSMMYLTGLERRWRER
jgi:hypothetical protein